MASFTKFTDSAVISELRHNNRVIRKDKNKDIDLKRTVFNRTINPNLSDSLKAELSKSPNSYFKNRQKIVSEETAFYKKRISECYCYKNRDLKTAFGCVIPLPENLINATPDIQINFFYCVRDFMCSEFGQNSIVDMTIHCDEKAIGKPHLHVVLLSAVKIDHDALKAKPRHPKALDTHFEKICLHEILTKDFLKAFHPKFQSWIDSHGFKGCQVYKGGSSGKKINLSVEQLKTITEETGKVLKSGITVDEIIDLIKENDMLREKLKNIEIEKTQNVNSNIDSLWASKSKDITKNTDITWDFDI